MARRGSRSERHHNVKVRALNRARQGQYQTCQVCGHRFLSRGNFKVCETCMIDREGQHGA